MIPDGLLVSQVVLESSPGEMHHLGDIARRDPLQGFGAASLADDVLNVLDRAVLDLVQPVIHQTKDRPEVVGRAGGAVF